jgi:hypothetical protein
MRMFSINIHTYIRVISIDSLSLPVSTPVFFLTSHSSSGSHEIRKSIYRSSNRRLPRGAARRLLRQPPSFPSSFFPISVVPWNSPGISLSDKSVTYELLSVLKVRSEDFMGRGGSAGRVTRVRGFVGGRCPFKHDGKSCFAQRRMSSRRFAAVKGGIALREKEKESQRESCTPESYGGRAKRTRAIYV